MPNTAMMRRDLRYLGYAALLLVANPARTATLAASTPDVIETFEQGSINWSHHLWRVRGHSLPVSPALSFGGPVRQAGGALTLARADARSRLEALRAAMFWGTPGPAAAQRASQDANYDITPWGEGRSVATQFFADGHVTLTQDFAWDGALAEAMWQARAAVMQIDAEFIGQSIAAAPQGALAGVPTGLVVNARGLVVRPALLPELHDDSGAILSSIRDVHPEALSHFGVARYSHSLDAAVKDERMGAHPAVVRAHASIADAPWHLVVDARQAAIVQAAHAALAQGKMIIVMDETGAAASASASGIGP